MTDSAVGTWWKFVSDAIETQGLTASEVASAAGINASTLSHWKSGRGRPTLDLVRSTAHALNVGFVDALVASALMTLEELQLERVRPDLAQVSDREIMDEAARRVQRFREHLG